ncbi:hypothetical protein N7486_011299 [Penicillium sp. IBT 16267x]|nr:hypothetical protein N7486_011299 [Penicillium sp. IBT 16267x]
MPGSEAIASLCRFFSFIGRSLAPAMAEIQLSEYRAAEPSTLRRSLLFPDRNHLSPASQKRHNLIAWVKWAVGDEKWSLVDGRKSTLGPGRKRPAHGAGPRDSAPAIPNLLCNSRFLRRGLTYSGGFRSSYQIALRRSAA